MVSPRAPHFPDNLQDPALPTVPVAGLHGTAALGALQKKDAASHNKFLLALDTFFFFVPRASL